MEEIIETKRLLLREILPSDAKALFELDSDPEVHRYLGNKPIREIAQAVEVINFIKKQYVELGIGRLAVIEKESNKFIGWAGLKLVKEEINNHSNYYDLGYRLIRKNWGRGYASEAATASVEYGFHRLGAKEIFAFVDAQNVASNRVLQKAGLKFIEQFYYDGIEHNWYKIEKKNF